MVNWFAPKSLTNNTPLIKNLKDKQHASNVLLIVIKTFDEQSEEQNFINPNYLKILTNNYIAEILVLDSSALCRRL